MQSHTADNSSRPGEKTAYLGLGSNLGDRDRLLRAALNALAEVARITLVSSVWDTAPMLVEDQPRFHNIVALAHTTLDPVSLLHEIKRIERELGRNAGPRYGPRPIDIDILLYDDLTLSTSELTIPHAHLAERAFVLEPLTEIAPGAWHPVLHLDAQTLAAQAPASDVRRLGPLMS